MDDDDSYDPARPFLLTRGPHYPLRHRPQPTSATSYTQLPSVNSSPQFQKQPPQNPPSQFQNYVQPYGQNNKGADNVVTMSSLPGLSYQHKADFIIQSHATHPPTSIEPSNYTMASQRSDREDGEVSDMEMSDAQPHVNGIDATNYDKDSALGDNNGEMH